MSVYTRLISSVAFPLHECLKRHSTVAIRRRLETSQWMSAVEIEQEAVERLRGFLVKIKSDVPYYRSALANFDIGRINTLADLHEIPLLTKSIIREQGDAFRASSAGPLQRLNTGGSTGSPLIFYLGLDRVSHDVAAKWRATRWWQVDIGDREIVVWGSPIELGAQDAVRAIRDRMLRTRLLSAFEMNAAKMAGYLDQIVAFRPASVFGYPSSICQLAQYAGGRGIRLDNIGTKVVFVTAERLYDYQRDELERAFGCPVANGYGAREAGFIAHECPHGSMHISAEDIVVEIIDPNGAPVPAGGIGEIVVTHLATAEFPFLRYRTGDIASISGDPCECGRGLPVLDNLQGRSTDFVVAANGTVMHGLALIYILRDMAEISEFRIIQESLELTRVLIVPAAEFGEDRVSDVVENFKQRLGRDVQIEVELQEKIESIGSGKHRYVMSKVPVPRYG